MMPLNILVRALRGKSASEFVRIFDIIPGLTVVFRPSAETVSRATATGSADFAGDRLDRTAKPDLTGPGAHDKTSIP